MDRPSPRDGTGRVAVNANIIAPNLSGFTLFAQMQRGADGGKIASVAVYCY